MMHLLFIAMLVLAPCFVRADGLPYVDDALLVDILRLRLDEEQIEQASATGEVILTDHQLSIVHRFYPKLDRKVPVASITTNDNTERLEAAVDAIWSAADEIAITIVPECIGSGRSDLIGKLSESKLRLGPKGLLYMGGKCISLEDAFKLIGQAAASKEPSEEVATLSVTVPPAFRQKDWHIETNAQSSAGSEDKLADTTSCNQRVAELLSTLTALARSRNVLITKSW